MVDITAEYLAQALEASASSFADGELAYLALTSKAEHPLRDRLAWALHTQLPDLVIAREWNYADLAILDQTGSPVALIEAKALYTFDIRKLELANVRKYAAMVKSDIAKSFTLLGDRPGAVFALVLVTHPLDAPPAHLGKAIAYRSGIQAAFNSATEEEIRAGARKSLTAALKPLGPVIHGSLAAGAAFGVRAVVDYAIVGPVAKPLGN